MVAILRAFVLLVFGSVLLGLGLVARYGGRPANLGRGGRVIEIGHGQIELWSESYDLDREFGSMQGPASHQRGVRLLATEHPELLWITGVRTDVVGVDGRRESVPKYFCHANLMRDQQGDSAGLESRILTLVPGRLGIALPRGYGIPIRSDQPLDFYSMALNRGGKSDARNVRFRTRISFETDAESRGTLQPLALHALYVTDAIFAAPAKAGDDETAEPGAGCDEHRTASHGGILERFGPDRTIHWMVPSGRHEYTTTVDEQLDLPSDTIVAYATAHLHRYGESLSLKDTTTGETVLTLDQHESPDGTALEESSVRGGIPLAHDHRYELTAVYDNDTAKPIDAMGILYLYVLDTKFDRSAMAPNASPSATKASAPDRGERLGSRQRELPHESMSSQASTMLSSIEQ